MRKVCCAAVLGLAMSVACALPGGGPSPQQLVRDALQGLVSAGSFHVSGSVTSGFAYTVDLVVAGGNLDGTVHQGRLPLDVRKVNGRLFGHGAQYFSVNKQPLLTDAYWVLHPVGVVPAVVETLSDWRSLTRQLQAAAGGVTQMPGPSVSGRRTIRLVGEGLSMLVPEQGAPVPLSLSTPPGTVLPSHLSDLSLVFDRYGPSVTIDVPTTVVDLNDRNTLPVHDVPDVTTFHFENCDRGGCTLASDVVNSGGRLGSATVQFRVRQGNQQLASCQVPVPVLDNMQRTRLSCRVDYDTTLEVTGGVLATNPDGVS